MEGKISEAADPPQGFGSPSNVKSQSQPHSVPTGHVTFRVLCFAPGVASDVIKEIEQSTESKIWVEEASINSTDKVITIIGPSRVSDGGIELSKAQKALIRVFEAISKGFEDLPVSCWLLVDSSYAGASVRNTLVYSTRMEIGCEIQIKNNLIFAEPDELMVKIKGRVPAVKSALKIISLFLEDWQQAVLKILCPTKRAGAVIGRDAVEALQSETGAVIKVVYGTAGCSECVVTALQKRKDPKSPAQRAIALIVSKIYETVTEKFLSIGSKFVFLAPLVVSKNHTEYLKGIISEIRKTSRASIKILEVEQNPKCISVNDRVVEISGTLADVEKALPHVTSNLLSNSEPVDINPYIGPEDSYFSRFSPTPIYSADIASQSHPPSEAQATYGLWPPRDAPRGVHDESEGLSSTMADLRLNSEHRSSSIATNTTVVDISVSEAVVNYLFARGQNRLRSVSQTSGARVIVHDPQVERSDRMIAISGTLEQIQTAQDLLNTINLDN